VAGPFASPRAQPNTRCSLAAKALQHNVSLVTRNVRDFAGMGLNLINLCDVLNARIGVAAVQVLSHLCHSMALT